MHTAAGMNDDYPVGRGVFKEEHSNFYILVNFEDHLEVVLTPETGEKLLQGLLYLKRLMKAFDKIGFAVDAYLGHLTVNPLNLGTGLKIRATFNNLSKTEDDCEAITKQYECRVSMGEDEKLTFESGVTLGANYTETQAIYEYLEAVVALCR